MTITCYAKCPHADACNAAGVCLWPVELKTGQPAPAHRDLTERVARAIREVRSNAMPTSELAKIAVAALAPELAVIEKGLAYRKAQLARLIPPDPWPEEHALNELNAAIREVALLGNEGEPK